MQFLDLGFIEHGLRILMAWLCSLIYPLITWLYDLFIYVSKVNILSNDMIKPIYQRVTLILTIIMVFYVTFEFVKYVVQPDGITDKEKGAGKIIYKMIAVVVLIAFVPSIFTGAYKLQNAIVEKNIIGKVILGTKGSVDENFGGVFSASILTMFYSVNEEYANEECDDIPCGALVGMNITSLRENRTLPYITMGLGDATDKKKTEYMGQEQKVTEAYINFDGLFAVVVGGFIVYILVLYCIDLGVRWAQLIYLQVIAPIPIIGFLAPKKDGIFQKWCKQCLTTFLDLFLRIAIMNFIILICGILLDPKHEPHLFANLAGIGGWLRDLVRIVLVLGLLLFAQKAPKLLGELFPKMGAASGNFGLKAGERVAPLAARAIGASAGGLNRLVKGGIGRAAANRKRYNEIKEKRRAAGKDTSWKAVNQDRVQAKKDERAARNKNKAAQKSYKAMQKATKPERMAVLAAEKELAEAKRSGNQSRIDTATKKLSSANKQFEQKRAEIQAQKSLAQAIASGDTTAITKARETLKAVQEQSHREGRVKGLESHVKTQTAEVEKHEKAIDAKKAAVTAAEENLATAKQSGDPTAIATAENALTKAIQDRDSMAVYQQDQIIASGEAEVANKEAEIQSNNKLVADAESTYATAKSSREAAETAVTNAQKQGQLEIDAATEALEVAKKSKDPNQIKAAEQALAQATVNRDMEVSKAQTNLKDAQQTETAAQSNLTAVKSERDTKNAQLQSAITTAKGTIETAKTARTAAIEARDQAYHRAQQSQKAAEEALNRRKQELEASDVAISTQKNQITEDYDTAQREYAQAQSNRAEIENQRYRSVVADTVAGAVGGAYRGFTTGGQATKLEDIRKKVSEGAKKDRENIAAHEKWLDSGGTTLGSKIVSSIDKNIGIPTEAQTTEARIKSYDSQIATNKRLSAIEGSVKTGVDAAESRSSSKLVKGEQKTAVRAADLATITYKGLDGKTQTLDSKYVGKTTSFIYADLANDAKTAREKAQSAQQAAANARAQGSPDAERLEQEADKLSKNASNSEQLLGQQEKALRDYAITHVLGTPEHLRRDTSVEPDQALVEEVENSLRSIEETKRNQDTYNKMVIALQKIDEKKGTHCAEAYRTGEIKDKETLDTIKDVLSTIKAARDRDTTSLSAMNDTLKASSRLDSQKAADSATGNK